METEQLLFSNHTSTCCSSRCRRAPANSRLSSDIHFLGTISAAPPIHNQVRYVRDQVQRCTVYQMRTVGEIVGTLEQFKIDQGIKRSAEEVFNFKVSIQKDTVMKIAFFHAKFPTFCGKWHSTCEIFPEIEKRMSWLCYINNNMRTHLTKHNEVTRANALCGPQTCSERW